MKAQRTIRKPPKTLTLSPTSRGKSHAGQRISLRPSEAEPSPSDSGVLDSSLPLDPDPTPSTPRPMASEDADDPPDDLQAAAEGRDIRRYHAKHRIVAQLIALHGPSDVIDHMRKAGFAPSARPSDVLRKVADLVVSERIRLSEGKRMESGDALVVVSGLARSATDERVRLAAARTILEVDGLLNAGKVPPEKERRKAVVELEDLIGRVSKRLASKLGSRSVQKALAQLTDGSASEPIDVEAESPSPTLSHPES